ncbi:MAG: hypothetical protein WB723_15015 [Candidatus Acidiferrales bacterium]
MSVDAHFVSFGVNGDVGSASIVDEIFFPDIAAVLNGNGGFFQLKLFVETSGKSRFRKDCPDNEGFGDEADSHSSLTDSASFLRIGNAKSGRGWVLDLDGRWISMTLEVSNTVDGSSLWIDSAEPGMSGSPILINDGTAVGIVAVGAETVSANGEIRAEQSGPQPVLMRNLPGWLITPLV